jgi:hypothetical protein
MSLIALRQELEESRAVATAARVSEEAGRQQLARMMDEEMAQTQTIETLRRNFPTTTGGIIGNTPFVPPFSTPSTGLRTRELHGPGYYMWVRRRTRDMRNR